MNNKQQLYNIAYLRSIAIILVVLYHAFCPYMLWHNFESDYSFNYYSLFTIWLGARMPLFLFLSGYLFSYLHINKGKYQSFKGFLANKTHRLFIPYIVFALLILFSNKNFSWFNFFRGYGHLWFILMLYWSFLTTWLIDKIKNPIFHICFLITSILVSFYIKNQIPLAINYFINYYVWFLSGYLVIRFHNKLKFIFSNKSLIVYSIIWIASSTLRNTINFPSLHILYVVRFLNALSFILLIFGVFERLFKSGHLIENTVVNSINKYSYGIYIFHGWVYNIVFKGAHWPLPYISPFAEEYTLLFPITFFLISLAVSYIATHYTLKTKVGRYLIG